MATADELVEKEAPGLGPPKAIPFLPDADDVVPVVREEILDFGNRAFLLHNVFSPSECKHYIAECEAAGWDGLGLYRQDYRNNLRIITHLKALAEVAFERIQPHLEDVEITQTDLYDIASSSMGIEGKWVPMDLNDRFRICKYEPGGHFAPHLDGAYIRCKDERSMKTFMIYLNDSDDFSGGATNFLVPDTPLKKDPVTNLFKADPADVIYAVKPEAGLAIVFNHHLLHEGQQIHDGAKYILRSDVVYQRISGGELSANDQQALELMHEAEQLESQGKGIEAVDKYRLAFKLSPNLADAYGM